MIKIEPNILLTPIKLEDANSIFTLINKERATLRKWLPFIDMTQSKTDTQQYVKSVMESQQKQYCIRQEERLVGLIGFNNTDLSNGKAEIGYWLSMDAERQGIIIQSVKKLLDVGFDELGLNRIQINVASQNVKSRKIPEKLGFKLEGYQRDGELLVDNIYTDLAIYSLLKREHQKNNFLP